MASSSEAKTKNEKFKRSQCSDSSYLELNCKIESCSTKLRHLNVYFCTVLLVQFMYIYIQIT